MSCGRSPVVLFALLLGVVSGCASRGGLLGRGAGRPGSADDQAVLDVAEAQSSLMSLSDSVTFSVADACERVARRTSRSDAKLRLASKRLGTALNAISAATSPNAYVGYVDLLTLVTLHRMSLEEPWAIEMFDEEDRRILHNTFAAQEALVWQRAGRFLTQRQQDELREMIVQWRRDNPEQSELSSVRLQEFAATRGVRLTVPNAEEATSIFDLLMLDPLANLAPATRELKEARLFAERMAFWAQRLPVVLGWQVELTSVRLLDTDQARQALANSAQIAQAAGDFSVSTDRMASLYERTLDEFPKERIAAIEQVDQAAAAQARAILDHAASIVADERARILADADTASQRLVDRMAWRLLLVIVIGALAVACICFMYRLIAARFAAQNATP